LFLTSVLVAELVDAPSWGGG